MKTIAITGGAGYVGCVLTQRLLNLGYKVIVLDTFWFWDSPDEFIIKCKLQQEFDNGKLEIIPGDIRDDKIVQFFVHVKSPDIIINLACISNDPSSDLDYYFTHDVSYNGVMNVIKEAYNGEKPLIQASSNSVYGNKKELEVTEDLIPEPLTQYSKIKLEIEHYLQFLAKKDDYPCVILRPSTTCGYSPRQRLDLVVNMFTYQAITNGNITVYGGDQSRPSVHIKDVVNAYIALINLCEHNYHGQIYNLGNENFTLAVLATEISNLTGAKIVYDKNVSDNRSYRICSNKIEKELNFEHKYSFMHGICEVKNALQTDLIDIKKSKNIDVIKGVLTK